MPEPEVAKCGQCFDILLRQEEVETLALQLRAAAHLGIAQCPRHCLHRGEEP